ncbi:MAG: hypothetical protein OEY49_19930, partial [Candidatus Heimdallarchaeota archaeon]|nr:hypothetical protein [Candidatus Heimdallarchaeota archaeon]
WVVIYFLEILLLPGSLLRFTIHVLFLRSRGWTIIIGLFPPALGNPAINVSYREKYRGYGMIVRPPSNGSLTLKDTILILLLSYSLLPVVFILIYFGDYIIYGLTHTLNNPQSAFILYIFIVFSITFGGMAVPEETMLPLYYFITSYPHFVLGVFLNYLGALIMSPVIGITFSFMLFNAVTIIEIQIINNTSKINRENTYYLNNTGDNDDLLQEITDASEVTF